MTLSTLGLTAERALALLDAREVSCEELAAAHLERIAAADGDVHAFLHTHPETTLERARELDRKGRSVLEGVPIALKDVIATRGVPTTAGSRMLEGFLPIVDADVVERCEAAGPCWSARPTWTSSPWARRPRTRPSSRRTTRGTSTASPAAPPAARPRRSAARRVPARLGTDTGGSIRQPAAFCGVVGLKPTYGRVSRYGLIAFASSLDQVGPFARTVARRRARCSTRSRGHDPRDSTSAPVAVPDYTADLTGDLKGLRVAVPREYFAGRPRPRRARRRPQGRRDASRRSAPRSDSTSRCPAPSTRWPSTTSSPRRGVAQPRPLRRREVRPRVAERRPRCGMYGADARATASATRSSGASCSAPTRSRPATTTPTTSRRSRCAR